MTPTARPVLYSFRRCPYAMRARLALLASGTACDIREVRLARKPPELLAASAKATVPVMVLPDGSVIDQSLDIMRWSLARADPEGWLDRDDPALIAANDGPFKHHLDRAKYPDRHDGDPAPHRAACVALLHELEPRLARADNLCGTARGLADMAILPFVRQFAAIDTAWFAAQPLPGVQRWLARHLGSALFEGAMVRLDPWQAGDAPVVFASANSTG
ncbi:glutathione S-transferase [Novosphingobium lentum]|uniref:glutathione S-transferase n=1 Tax=Novosphingobium lentum TaxID=145287 RepID=UPI00082FD5AB|nr:glutathione S-transferase [Novosphingobium lentum]